GDYSNETDPAELKPYVDAIVNAGGYAVLDLQPGRARLLDQAKIYEDLLKHPNVGLALDPEWKIGPDEVPMTNIGHVNADEVNEVADWLAQLVANNNLPQKALVLHQFQLQMLRDRELIKTDYPELAFVLHADGHGDSGQKMETWNALRQDLSPDYFMAWKNFIDEDTPMFDPAQTYAVDPRPWFVSYQ
ncbi:MAG: cell wall-binding repeat-containing protein, partial [Corynebacterium sp.]|nr:cell wall-binding repeat-containing protein [Corynebacterium sp.]